MKQFTGKSYLGAILAGASLVLAAGVANAAKPSNEAPSACERTTANPVAKICDAEFQGLYADIKEAWASGAFTSVNNAVRDCNGIIAKADNAVAKTNQMKLADARAKLQGIIDAVGGTGIEPTYANAIRESAIATQTCLTPQ